METKTHYRRAFKSPYLSSADITGPTTLTIKCVRLEPDQTNKTKDSFNTAYFVEKDIRPGEKLKPMVLNVTNSKVLAKLSGSKFIDDWNNIPVTITVDENVRFGRDIVEGLRIAECDYLNASQLKEIKDMLTSAGIINDEQRMKKMREYLGISSVETMPKSLYGKAKAAIAASIKAAQ